MLSPEEKRLILGILALLVLGAAVKMMRQHVNVEHTQKVELPSVDASPKRQAKDSRAD